MARPLRLECAGALWHVTSRGNEGRAIVRDDADREAFLQLLARAVARFEWILHAWVLMTNHFHLVIETPQPTLSRGMHWLNGCFAQRFNRRHKRSGHLFQGRFKGILVESEEYLLGVCRYAVLNPVRAGMVARAEDYAWSSYRATAGHAPVPAWLDPAPLLGRLRRDPGAARELYREFVNTSMPVPCPWENLNGQMFLGGAAWLGEIQARIDAEPRSDEHPRAQREEGCPSLGEIAEVVAERCGLSVDTLLSRHAGDARRLVAWLSWDLGRLRLRQIAAALGVRSRGYVSSLIRSREAILAKDPRLREIHEACCARLRPPPPVSRVAAL